MCNQQLRLSPTHHFSVTQIPLSLRALVAENVTPIRAAVRRFSGRRNLEPALHSLVSLLLGHLFHLHGHDRPKPGQIANCTYVYFFRRKRGEYSGNRSAL